MERKLEDDEARIDNLLCKIVACTDEVASLLREVEATEQARMIAILNETIATLADLADRIDQDDEELVKEHLHAAIGNISDARKLRQ